MITNVIIYIYFILIRSAHLHVNITDCFSMQPQSCGFIDLQMKFLRHMNSNLFSYDRNHPFVAVEVNLQRSVTYNMPSQPTFLACIPLPGRINITVNVYMRTALRATVSPTPRARSLSLFLFFSSLAQRVSVSHFFSPRGEPSRLTFLRVAHPTIAVVYNSQNWPRTRDFYVHTYVRNERRLSLWTTLH